MLSMEDRAHCVATLRRVADEHMGNDFLVERYRRSAQWVRLTGRLSRYVARLVAMNQKVCKLCLGRALYRVGLYGYCSDHRSVAFSIRKAYAVNVADRAVEMKWQQKKRKWLKGLRRAG